MLNCRSTPIIVITQSSIAVIVNSIHLQCVIHYWRQNWDARVDYTKGQFLYVYLSLSFVFIQTSSDGNSTTSVLTFVPVKPTKPRHQEPVGGGEGNGDESGRTSEYDGRLTCRAENPQHQQSTSQRKHTIAAGSDSSDDAGTPFIQSTWLLRIQCEYSNNT